MEINENFEPLKVKRDWSYSFSKGIIFLFSLKREFDSGWLLIPTLMKNSLSQTVRLADEGEPIHLSATTDENEDVNIFQGYFCKNKRNWQK
jgi:hypothetical protein